MPLCARAQREPGTLSAPVISRGAGIFAGPESDHILPGAPGDRKRLLFSLRAKNPLPQIPSLSLGRGLWGLSSLRRSGGSRRGNEMLQLCWGLALCF